MNAVCLNKDGSYWCNCTDGFTGIGTNNTCFGKGPLSDVHTHTAYSSFPAHADVDECVDGSHSCSDDATCHNSIGNYSCTCIVGYEGNGFECSSKTKFTSQSNKV